MTWMLFSPFEIVLQAIDVFFVRGIVRVDVNPNFSDRAPFFEPDETVTRPLRELDGFARMQGNELVRLRVRRTDGDADGSAHRAPILGAAVVILPREAAVGRDEQKFRTAFTAPRVGRDFHAGKKSVYKFVGLGIRHAQKRAPWTRRINFLNFKTLQFQM